MSDTTQQKKIANDFNTVLNGMLSCMAKYHGDADPGVVQAQNVFNGIISVQSCVEEPIANFIMHIYRNDTYRELLAKGDDKFFQIIKEDHNNNVNWMKLLALQDIWVRSDDELKQFIKKSLMALIKLCEKYIGLL